MKITLTAKQIKEVVRKDKEMQMAKAWVARCLKEIEERSKANDK